jgi:hypothetical protein
METQVENTVLSLQPLSQTTPRTIMRTRLVMEARTRRRLQVLARSLDHRTQATSPTRIVLDGEAGRPKMISSKTMEMTEVRNDPKRACLHLEAETKTLNSHARIESGIHGNTASKTGDHVP